MPEELKIVVSAPGAEQTTSALRKLHQAERELSQAIGAAAKAEAADVNKAAAAKKGASAAAGELTMRHKSLLREMAMLSPECAVAANAINSFQQGLTGAALGLSLVGIGIMAVTTLYGRYSKAQAEEKEKADALLASLRQQYDAYLKIAEAAEKVGRSRRGLGAGTGTRLSRRALAVAPEGVGPETAQQAAELAEAAGRPITDEELAAAEAALVVEPEPRGKTQRGQAQRLFGNLTPDRRAALAKKLEAWTAESPELARAAEIRKAGAALALRPEAQTEQIITEVIAKEAAAGRPITRERLQDIMAGRAEWIAPGSTADAPYERNRAAALEMLTRYPQLGRVRMTHTPSGPMFTGPAGEGRPLVQIYHIHGDVHQGGVQYKGQESDPAGIIQRSGQR